MHARPFTPSPLPIGDAPQHTQGSRRRRERAGRAREGDWGPRAPQSSSCLASPALDRAERRGRPIPPVFRAPSRRRPLHSGDPFTRRPLHTATPFTRRPLHARPLHRGDPFTAETPSRGDPFTAETPSRGDPFTRRPLHHGDPFTAETPSRGDPFAAGSFLPPSLGCFCSSCLECPSRSRLPNPACSSGPISNVPASRKPLGIPTRNQGLPWWLSGKASACDAGATGDLGSIPGMGRSPGRGHGSPPQCSCLENPKDRGAWWATVCGVAELTRLKRLSTHTPGANLSYPQPPRPTVRP